MRTRKTSLTSCRASAKRSKKSWCTIFFEQIIKTLLEPYYGATYRLQDLFCQLIDILSNAQYYNVQHDVHHGRGGKHAEKHKKMCRR